MLEDWFRPYEQYEAEVEELLDLGSGVAFIVAVHNGRLVGGSAAVQWRQGFVLLYDGDLIGRIASYRDIDEARAAAERLAEDRRCRRRTWQVRVRSMKSGRLATFA
jgi:hypothetical protein